MTLSRREVLIGMAGLLSSSLRVLAEPRFMECKSGSNDPFHIEGFTCSKVTAADMTYRLYQSQSSGPAVLLLHELPGLYKEDVELGRRIAQCGFTVYMPLFFGKPNGKGHGAHVLWYGFSETVLPGSPFPGLRSGHTSRVARWLNELLPSIHRECGNKGVGVVGMCLTGALPLALTGSGDVRAVVLCQPALPYFSHSGLDVSETDIKTAKDHNVDILALKFSADGKSPDARWRTLEKKFSDENYPGNHYHELIIRSGDGSRYHAGAHSIFGEHFNDVKGDDAPTHVALQRALGFLDNRISDKPHLPDYPDQQPCSPPFLCYP
ncbi:MAG: dienelactone hydrolase family protein [Candidatus Angelobacter sp.]